MPIYVALILIFCAFAAGEAFGHMYADDEEDTERMIQWQQGYNAGWDDAIKNMDKERRETKERKKK